MKFSLSLRWSVALVFLLVVLALIIGYSVLTVDYFRRGMDNILALHMERAAKLYLATVPEPQRTEPKWVLGYQVTPEWTQLPATTLDKFSTPPPQPNKLFKAVDPAPPKQHPPIEFLFRYDDGGDTVYVTSRVTPDSVSEIVGHNARQNWHTLMMISLGTTLAITAVIWWLLRRTSGPVSRLLTWTGELNPQSLQRAAPDFSFPELNQLAQLIQDSLSSVQDSLDREHRFLRHASHELRTPIATLLSNMELLRKLKSLNTPNAAEQEAQVIDRLERASLTMKSLTETLLWLGREGGESLPTKTVNLDALVEQLVEEMRYLLKDKGVAIKLETAPYSLELPEAAARIVLGNLIRNAFQHTWTGDITIRQTGSEVRITNTQSESGDDDLGFGLGLELTRQLSVQLAWHYENEVEEGMRRAAIRFA